MPAKKRFSAGALTGDFPAAIDPLDSDIEGKIVSGLTRELNDCYCLNLSVNPNLQRGSASPLLELGKGKLVLVGASHTYQMSALIPASLETQFLKLPGQSQTNDGVGEILAAIEQGNLKNGDFLYMDLLSNVSFMGTGAAREGWQQEVARDQQLGGMPEA